MHRWRPTLWGDFAEVEGTYIQKHLTAENILLVCRVHIRDYQGIFTSTWYTFIHKTVYFSLFWLCISVISFLACNIHLRILVSTLPVSRLLINPDIKSTEDIKGWYIQNVILTSVFILHARYTLDLTCTTFRTCTRYSGITCVVKHFDFMLMRILHMYHLEKLFVVKMIRLYEYATMPNASYKFITQMFLMLTYIHLITHNFPILLCLG